LPYLLPILLALFPSALFAISPDSPWPGALAAITERLRADKVSPKFVDLLTPKRVVFAGTAVRFKLLDIVADPPDPSQFVSDLALRRARKFMKRHHGTLLESWNRDCVPPSVVVAVLSVETTLGSYPPKFNVLATLASLAALSDEKLQEVILDDAFVYATAHTDRYHGLSRINWPERAKSIGEDWYRHLRAYLSLAEFLGWPTKKVTGMKGSFTGAIGYSQWQPERAFERMMVERFDLWSWADSIRHTSSELAEKGFGSDPAGAFRAYNRAVWYRKGVLAMADGLAGEEEKLFPDLQDESCSARKAAGQVP
jgi:hypothetical protein